MSNLRQTQDFFFKACALALQAIPPRAKLSARWLSQEAKRLGFLARSAFKLQARAGGGQAQRATSHEERLLCAGDSRQAPRHPAGRARSGPGVQSGSLAAGV